jgi:hypothetical protein
MRRNNMRKFAVVGVIVVVGLIFAYKWLNPEPTPPVKVEPSPTVAPSPAPSETTPIAKSKYAKKYGEFSKAAKILPEVQDAFEKSQEYQKGVSTQASAMELGEEKDAEKADKLYMEAIQHFLKAASEHPEADITLATFRSGHMLMSMVSKPDYESTYLFLKYTVIVNPKGTLAIMGNNFLEEIKPQIPPEKIAQLDTKAEQLVNAKALPSLPQ